MEALRRISPTASSPRELRVCKTLGMNIEVKKPFKGRQRDKAGNFLGFAGIPRGEYFAKVHTRGFIEIVKSPSISVFISFEDFESMKSQRKIQEAI